jgi:hypothetical protein
MKTSKKHILGASLGVAIIGAYPLFVLMYTWSKVAQSDFKGGRHGQLDAYRHTLASAIVAYTLNEGAVDLVTCLMEREEKASNQMDRHNNRIGAAIGSEASSFSEIEAVVWERVTEGRENSDDETQITWLPEEDWRDGWIY